MLIRARLKGHEFDLLTLAELLGAGDPAVAANDEGYYLRFTAPTNCFATAEACTTPPRCCCAGSTAWPRRSAATSGRWA